MMDSLKLREDRARRALRRIGYRLAKTPARSSLRDIEGVGYLVIQNATNSVHLGGQNNGYSATIEEVEDFVEIQTTINETTVPFVMDFFDTQCREVPGGRVDRDDMRRAYDTWCIKTGAELLPWEVFDQVFLSQYPNHRISKGVYENVELVEDE